MESQATQGNGGERISRATIVALVAMGLSVLVLANDFTALSVALTSMEKDFHTDVSTAQWVINAYALVFGVLIVTGGRLADMFGRRRIFFIGCAFFAVFSGLGGVAPNEGTLIATRAIMGIGGALMWPAILGMTFAALPQSKAGLAGGFILGIAGLGNALGPLIGGVLSDALSWRWIFFLNLPVTAFAAFVTWRSVPESREDAEDHRIDYRGIASLSLGLVALLLALDQSSDYGWADPRTIGMLAVSAISLVIFPLLERGAGRNALVPRDVMRNREFTAACMAVLMMSATFFATLVYGPQFMEKLLGYSPLESGAGLLPMMATFGVVSFVAGNLYAHLPHKLILAVGTGCIAVGPLLLSFADANSSYAELVPGLAVLGLGIGLFYSTVTTVAVEALDPSRSSLAGGIVYMFQIAGGSVGLGLSTAVFNAASDGSLSAATTATFVPDKFAEGFERTMQVDAALAAVGFVVTVLFVGGSLLGRRAKATAGASP